MRRRGERRNVVQGRPTVDDVLGRQVRTVVSSSKEGRHEQTLDVSGLSSGVYFLRLEAGGTIRTQKLTVVQ